MRVTETGGKGVNWIQLALNRVQNYLRNYIKSITEWHKNFPLTVQLNFLKRRR
jgi:hypothetical protein